MKFLDHMVKNIGIELQKIMIMILKRFLKKERKDLIRNKEKLIFKEVKN